MVLEHLADDERDLAHLREGDSRRGIEIDAELVGVVEVVGANRVRVQVEAAQVHHPGEAGGVVHHHLVGGAAGGNASCAVVTHSGRGAGARFWKKNGSSAPFGNRFSAIGRFFTPRTAPGATAR